MPLTQVSAGLLDSQASAQGFRNRVINGDMRIDQRNNGASGTVSSSAGYYPVDRFQCIRANGYITSGTVQQFSDGPTGFTKSIKYTSTNAETPTGALYSVIVQYIEGYNLADFGWGSSGASSATLSFWVKLSITGTFGVTLRSGDASLSYATTFTYSSANTWQYVTLSIPGPTTGGTTAFPVTNGTGVGIFWELGTGPSLTVAASSSWQSANALGVTGTTKLNSTAGATYQITGVQLEAGTVATQFERLDYGRQLIQCQRYYEYGLAANFAVCTTGVGFGVPVLFKVEKRAAPTIVSTSLSSNIGSSSAGPQSISVSGYAYSFIANGTGAGNVQISYTAASEL